jgi:hypothetical protein
MPLYSYRCRSKHTVDRFFPMGKQAKEIRCETCKEIAVRVFTVPHIAVDNMDKIDMTVATGRNFSNKREFDAWLKSKNAHVMDDSEWASDREYLAQEKEFRKDLAAKGIDYGEYMADKKDRENRERDEKLKQLGVKLESASKEDFLNANESTGWVDTVEDKYVGNDGRMVAQTERVECPYSDLTNGAVSNV